ncbi:hypothetical protein F5888DRAFT_397646 [Russula emetica]|nr:hypothetical protein F5888DRAFT_397646 [Russula emetica]
MQRSKDADHLIYSDATYPVGPDVHGRITYVHVPPLSPLTIIMIALLCIAIATFLCCYIYPVVRKCYDSRRSAKVGRGSIKPPLVLASTRSLFGLRVGPQMMPSLRKPRPSQKPELLLAHYGRPDMRIARPQPALSLSRGSKLSPLLSPSLSTSCSTSPSTSHTLSETPPTYSGSPSPISEVVVAPVDMGIPGQTIENRTTPKKEGEYYEV